jgi:cytochrome c oxidase subunit 1
MEAKLQEIESKRTYLDEKGIRSWLFTLDHKRIGLMYLFTSLIFFLVGGLFAIIFRTELAFPGKQFLSPEAHNILFTLHGAMLIFLVIIPLIPSALGNFFLPIMIGARDVAFPRINLLSYWVFFTGALLLLFSLLFGPIDTGWTFYTPYSANKGLNVFIVSLAIFILGMSSILTGMNFIVTVHKLRAPGMTWGKLPLFVWALYATSLVQLLATPVLGITLLLLGMENILGIGFFNPAKGGDPVLFQHLFWFYSHPAVYIMILPAFGVISELVSVHSRKPIFGYWFIAASSLAIAFIGFIVWGHHMFVAGMSPIADIIFSFLTYLVAIPTAVKIFNWTATLYKGKISFTTPMLYALGFISLFLIGGLTGLFLASLGTDIHLHDTYFVVGHFHYVMVGAAVFAFFGALFHWTPKMFGRMYNEKWAKIGWFFNFLGFNLAFFPHFILGIQGMPRRYWDYPAEFQSLHFVSTIGAYFIALGVLISLAVFIHAIFKGEKAEDNPWGGKSLEWTIPSPPPTENFEKIPVVKEGPYDFVKH